MAEGGGAKAVVAALLANLGIAATKFVAYALTGSSAMLAEGVHSVADSGNQVLLLVGGRRAERDATPQHPFGFGRARYVYAFVVAIVLFSVGGLFALYEAWHKFSEPEPIESWRWVPVAVLLVALALEGASLRTAVREAGRVRGRRSWPQFVRTSKAPELPVVLLEDFGALIGLGFALVGVGLTLVTGDGRWDAAGTAMIGLLLVSIAAVLAVEMSSLLLGESASPEHVRAVERALPGSGVLSVIHLRTLHLGPEELLVAAKVAVAGNATGADVARAIDAAEERVRAAVPIARVIYLEPDLRGAERRDPGPPSLSPAVAPQDGGGVDDSREPEDISRERCWELLGLAPYGRLAVVVDSAPEVFPVNHLVADVGGRAAVLFRTAAGTKLFAGVGRDVAFEADGVDAGTDEAWSVVVTGVAELVEDPATVAEVTGRLVAWHGTDKPHVVAVGGASVSGRRFRLERAR